MQHEIEFALVADQLPSDLYVIIFRWLRTKICADSPVNCNPSVSDQLITMASRSNARCSEETIKTQGYDAAVCGSDQKRHGEMCRTEWPNGKIRHPASF